MTRPATPVGRRAMPRRRRSAGLGLVTAIFLLVVLSGMAVAMMTLTTTQHTSGALDIQGARAYQAARAGVEFGLFRALQGGAANTCAAGTITESFAMPAGTSLSGFSVTVVCTATNVEITPAPNATFITVRQLTATACNQPNASGACPNASNSPDYVQRVLNAQF